MSNPYRSDFDSMGLINQSPWAILDKRIYIAPKSVELTPAADKKRKQRERMSLKEKALRVNLRSDIGTPAQVRKAKDKTRVIRGASTHFRTA